MTSTPGVDHPEEQTEAEVSLTGRGVSVSSRVEFVNGDVITVRPSAGAFVDQVVVRVGDAVDVFWQGSETRRSVPAEVVEVQQGAVVRWRMRTTGPAEESQRRSAVRGRVTLPVVADYNGVKLKGETVDISEGGLRGQFEGFGLPPEGGSRLQLTVELDDGPVTTKAEVVRNEARGARWLMSIQFVDPAERDQDRLRRRVFQALREERARTVD